MLATRQPAGGSVEGMPARQPVRCRDIDRTPAALLQDRRERDDPSAAWGVWLVSSDAGNPRGQEGRNSPHARADNSSHRA